MTSYCSNTLGFLPSLPLWMPPAVNRRGQLQAASRLSTLNDKELVQGSPAFLLETHIRHFKYSSLGSPSRPRLRLLVTEWSVWNSVGGDTRLESQTQESLKKARRHISPIMISSFEISVLSSRIVYRAPFYFPWTQVNKFIQLDSSVLEEYKAQKGPNHLSICHIWFKILFVSVWVYTEQTLLWP